VNIITFYSYKGGTGRSLCLVNVAVALHLSYGQKVGLIDLDCEASGLHHLFEITCRQNGDLLNFLHPRNRSISKIEQYVHEVQLVPGAVPGIFMIPTISDPKLLEEVPWDKGVEAFLSHEVFPALQRIYNLDYLLIDSRSGIASYASYALRAAHCGVLVCRPDRQNRFGISKMIEICKAAGKPYLVCVSACPNPKKNIVRLSPLFKALGEETTHVFPYMSELYFEEFISTLKMPHSALAKAYGELAKTIYNFGRE